MQKTIQDYIQKCTICLQFHPSKERMKLAGLPVSLLNLNLMDWIIADAFSIKDSNFLALGDRCSSYVWAWTLKNMEAETVKAILDEISDTYSGPPNRITSDGGTNLAASMITEWCKKNRVTHNISAVELLVKWQS